MRAIILKDNKIHNFVMRPLIYKYLILLASVSMFVTDAASQDAAEILDKMDKIVFSPKDKQGKVTIILIG